MSGGALADDAFAFGYVGVFMLRDQLGPAGLWV